MEYVLFLLGIFIGTIMGRFILTRRVSSGTLKIDHSNPEKDKYLFVIDGELDQLSKKKKILLKVDNNADLSQK